MSRPTGGSGWPRSWLGVSFILAFSTLALGAEYARASDAVEVVEDLDLDADFEEVIDESVEFTPLRVLGRLHSAVVHFPIAWLPLLVAYELLLLWRRREEPWLRSWWLVAGTAVAFLPGVVTGLLRLGEFSADAETMAPAILHRNVMLAALLLVAVATVLRARVARVGSPAWATYLALLALSSLLVFAGGHLGGQMVFGENFLPF